MRRSLRPLSGSALTGSCNATPAWLLRAAEQLMPDGAGVAEHEWDATDVPWMDGKPLPPQMITHDRR